MTAVGEYVRLGARAHVAVRGRTSGGWRCWAGPATLPSSTNSTAGRRRDADPPEGLGLDAVRTCQLYNGQ